ncbi:hypothetical protein [uncultured Lacinutrix sp.]|uniref:hypothetical protein n=1 Tax=uncultured Lacinutrix sp. TaxID=574032 RepID=UPI00262DF57E|nr:hypothetical protein [uncultured Lacinutrix sp.]
MKTVTLNQTKLIITTVILLSALTTKAFNISLVQVNSQLPSFLIGTYNGSLMTNNTMKNNGSCTIKRSRNSSYIFTFSNGIQSIRNIKFSKDDDTYTSSFIYKGKTFAVIVDEDGDLVINSTSGYSNILSFSGAIDISHNSQNNTSIISSNGEQSIATDSNSVFVQNGNQTIRNNNTVELHNETQGIRATNDSVNINNGNVNISTNSTGVSINGSINIGHHQPNVQVEICYGWTNCSISNCSHENTSQHYYECGSHEISQLPKHAIGFYKGKLNGYRTDTKKGICKIVETGCKTYRLDFSNNLPSIHGVQFGRINNFEEYTSVVIEGQYSAAIEIDMTFKDLSIDGEIMAIDFDGDKQ